MKDITYSIHTQQSAEYPKWTQPNDHFWFRRWKK